MAVSFNCSWEHFSSLVMVTLVSYLLVSTEVMKENIQQSNVSQSIENSLKTLEWLT